jgi:hypothetical protein
MSEALLAQGCLQSAGIESFLADANIARLEWQVNVPSAVALLDNATLEIIVE